MEKILKKILVELEEINKSIKIDLLMKLKQNEAYIEGIKPVKERMRHELDNRRHPPLRI